MWQLIPHSLTTRLVILFNKLFFMVSNDGNFRASIETELLREIFTGLKSVTTSPGVPNECGLIFSSAEGKFMDSSWIQSFWTCTKAEEMMHWWWLFYERGCQHRQGSGQVWTWSSWGTGRLEIARTKLITARVRYCARTNFSYL